MTFTATQLGAADCIRFSQGVLDISTISKYRGGGGAIRSNVSNLGQFGGKLRRLGGKLPPVDDTLAGI